jgi:D-alanyl-D-alanine endopeptidase (penicillin-binding protein 7)
MTLAAAPGYRIEASPRLDEISDSGLRADPWQQLDPRKLQLRSEAALIIDADGNRLYSKKARHSMPIASITKLMTAMVVLDSGAALDHLITIRDSDRDLLRLTGSRLKAGKATLTRRKLLTIALMASENRAAAALGRTTIAGGTAEFVRAMNRKARSLKMGDSRFVDATGLDAGNLSTPEDLVKLLRAARGYDLIRRATTTRSLEVRPYRNRGPLRYVNTNRLLKNARWKIGLSKTGYINEAGRCLVMETRLFDRTLFVVLLNSFGKLTPFGDSNRLRRWIAAQVTES